MKEIFKLTRLKIIITIILALALTLPFFLVAIDNDSVYGFFGMGLSLTVSILLFPISLVNNSLNTLLDFLFSGFTFWKDKKDVFNLLTFIMIGTAYCYFISSVIIYILNNLPKQKKESKK